MDPGRFRSRFAEYWSRCRLRAATRRITKKRLTVDIRSLANVLDIRSWATLGSIWVLCAIMAGIAAGEKNRRFWIWFLFGLLTGPYALFRAIRATEVDVDVHGRRTTLRF